MLDLVQLRSFVEVADRRTVSAAAAALGYTPPAVTQQLAKLERTLGATLFERAGGRLTLTARGLAVLPMVRDMLALAVQVSDAAQAEHRDRVVVTGIASALQALLPPRLARIAALGNIVIVEAEDAASLRALASGDADVAIVQEYPGDELQRAQRLRYEDAVTDELRLVLPPGTDPNTRLRDLDGTNWIVNGTGTRCEAATREVLARRGVNVNVVADVTDNHALLGLVAAGVGATFVPALILTSTSAQVTVATERPGVTRTILAVTRPAASPAARAVATELLAASPSK